MTDRHKLVVLAAAIVLLGIFGAGYLAWASQRAADDLATREARALEAIKAFSDSATPAPATTRAPKPTSVPARLASVELGVPEPGDILAVNRVPGDDYGRLTIVKPDGSRVLLDRRCDRVHVGGGVGVCAAPLGGALGGWETLLFDASTPGMPILSDHSSPLPSRARVSADGSIVSTTSFVSGRSYEDIGGDTSTIVVFVEVANNRLTGMTQYQSSAQLQFADSSAQYWGASFADPAGETFYATAHYGTGPVVVHGRVAEQTVSEPLLDGSCPSVSPDGTRLVYKAMRPGGGFDLTVYDIESGESRQLNETRSVDDQVEWLDDNTILYALHPEGESDELVDPSFDIWKLSLDEDAVPELIIPAASSPAVVR